MIQSFITKILYLALLLLLLIFPLVSFRIGLSSAIYPALEVILVYYFTTNSTPKAIAIFLIGIFFDQLYSMPIGTNSLAFMIMYLVLNLAAKFFLLKDYLTDFMIFSSYCFLILNFRYFLVASKSLYLPDYTALLFQYLTTIFSYNLLKIPLDKTLDYIKTNAK